MKGMVYFQSLNSSYLFKTLDNFFCKYCEYNSNLRKLSKKYIIIIIHLIFKKERKALFSFVMLGNNLQFQVTGFFLEKAEFLLEKADFSSSISEVS